MGNHRISRGAVCAVALVLAAVASAHASKRASNRFHFTGQYVEGCTCMPPCTCEMTGLEGGCQGVGAFEFTGGSFNGQSIAGCKIAYATEPGKWVDLIIDAPANRRKACEAFARKAGGAFGKIGTVTSGKISIIHHGYTYDLKVDGGKVMALHAVPILGLDKKTPLTYSNIQDPTHPTVMQGKTVTGSYHLGSHQFTLKDSNAFFNEHLNVNGKF